MGSRGTEKEGHCPKQIGAAAGGPTMFLLYRDLQQIKKKAKEGSNLNNPRRTSKLKTQRGVEYVFSFHKQQPKANKTAVQLVALKNVRKDEGGRDIKKKGRCRKVLHPGVKKKFPARRMWSGRGIPGLKKKREAKVRTNGTKEG